jgi:hypothetical protein
MVRGKPRIVIANLAKLQLHEAYDFIKADSLKTLKGSG